MKKNKYQYNYSKIEPKMHDFKGRREKALKIMAILEDFITRQLSKKLKTKDLVCLEIGCSLGGMTEVFAPRFLKITGIDIDEKAISKTHKKIIFENTTFKVDDALNLSFKDDTFDIVICNDIYEHVPDPLRMMKEIHRVLKKGGICYFSGPNKYTLMESDHSLPFLSWLPKSLGHFYLKITARGNYYYETTLSQSTLRKLTSVFKNYDYTLEVLKKPEFFRATHKFRRTIAHIPSIFLRPLLPFMPKFFWVLVKKN